MNLPTADEVFAVLDATWPAASACNISGWTIREGQGGGSRVSAATRNVSKGCLIKTAESAMLDLGQPPKFMVRNGEQDLDKELMDQGYGCLDPTVLYAGPVSLLTAHPVPHMSTFEFWPPLAIVKEIWADAGITDQRIAVMNRVRGPKVSILGRTENRASAAAFVAIERKIAMLHALEVTPALRRKGVGRNILRAAAHWAQEHGADFIALAVTAANVPANALYSAAGLTEVGKYHYRVKNEQETNRGST